jgi:hypothetical protein
MSSIFYYSLFFGDTEKFDDVFETIGQFNVLKHIFRPEKFYFLCLSINSALFFTTFIYTTLMHVFIFFELILMLMNPIGSASFRTNIYYIVSALFGAVTFFLHVGDDYINSVDLKDISKENPKTAVVIFSLFLVMTVLSVVHLSYSYKRLGKKFMKQGLYMKFLIKQLVMCITYFLCFAPFQIVMFCQAIKKKDILPEWLDEVALILFSLLGFIQFFFRVSDTNFYNVVWRCVVRNVCFWKRKDTNESSIDEKSKEGVSTMILIILISQLFDFFFNNEEPLSKLINKLMNLEFMCCVLYGFKEIYLKKMKKTKETNVSYMANTNTFILDQSLNVLDK